MPISAMPEHLNTREKIDAAFPDDSQYGTNWFGRIYRRYQKATKTWFCFSYRCTEWWARWRKYPIVLFAIRGDGVFRMEHEGGDDVEWSASRSRIWVNYLGAANYFSRIQYYCRWHFAIQWPLMISFHFYPNAEDVPEVGETRRDLDGKLVFGYYGHFDADLVYWMVTSGYIGRNWK